MKKVMTLVVLFVALATTTVMGQAKPKFGHINSSELMLMMPGRDDAEAEVKKLATTLQTRMQAMSTEYQQKLAAAQEKEQDPSTPRSELEALAKELRDLENRIQEFQTSAQDELAAKENELLEPMVKKAKEAIEKVAKANSFTYILDSGVGVILYTEGEDILPLVKKELGIE